jgi:hypothetical protein
MKRPVIAGLCLAAIFLAGIVAAQTAAAAPIWEQCQESSALGTKYSEHQCLKAEGAGKWHWAEPVGVDEVTGLGQTLRLTDTKALGGLATLECADLETTATDTPKSTITVIKINNPKTDCTRVEGGCKAGEVEVAEGINLPWAIRLTEKEGKVLGTLANGGNGEPGWKIQCNTALGKEVDECVSEGESKLQSMLLENKMSGTSGTELLVLATIEKTFKGKCSQGGTESGEVSSQLALLLIKGWGLRVS